MWCCGTPATSPPTHSPDARANAPLERFSISFLIRVASKDHCMALRGPSISILDPEHEVRNRGPCVGSRSATCASSLASFIQAVAFVRGSDLRMRLKISKKRGICAGIRAVGGGSPVDLLRSRASCSSGAPPASPTSTRGSGSPTAPRATAARPARRGRRRRSAAAPRSRSRTRSEGSRSAAPATRRARAVSHRAPQHISFRAATSSRRANPRRAPRLCAICGAR